VRAGGFGLRPVREHGGLVTGGVSPVKHLAATALAGTKPVASVVRATTRDVTSLDPLCSYGYPETQRTR